MFYCEFYKILKNTFFIEHLRWLLLIIPLAEAVAHKYSVKKTVLKDFSKIRRRIPAMESFLVKLQTASLIVPKAIVNSGICSEFISAFISSCSQ